MDKLLIITNYLDIFPQRISYTEGLDLNKIKSFLYKNSISTKIINYNKLNEKPNISKNYNYIFYCSSQNSSYKNFISDHIIKLALEKKILIPRLEHLIAHENKVFQSIFLTNKGIPYPKTRVISNTEEALVVLKKSSFPLVLKTSDGWGSKGVHLVSNYKQGKKLIKKYMNSEDYPGKKIGKLILQDFISDLSGDWKILIFGNKVACLYRKTRENDFRASGSGNFQFLFPPKKILDFAFKAKKLLRCSWISLDIMETKSKIYLGEYQVTHFGLLTALNCPEHLERFKGEYIKKFGPIDVDQEIALGILSIIKHERSHQATDSLSLY